MASDVTELPIETDAEFAQRFAALAARWREETAHISRMDKIAAHPAHREIVAMGARVVPLLLADLEKNRGHWLSRAAGNHGGRAGDSKGEPGQSERNGRRLD